MSRRAGIFHWFMVMIIAFVAGAPAARALTVSPIHIEMSTVGANGRAQVTVRNDSAEAIPVELTISRLAQDEHGGKTTSKAVDSFLVFPPQAMIPAGATQTFRLQWAGEPVIAASESFLLSVNQIPVRQPKGKASVQIVLSFGVVINVAPPEGAPALKVVGSGIETDQKTGKRRPILTVENPTNVHALLPNAKLRVAGGNWSHSFSPAEMSEKIGIGLVQPGKRRRFVLPVEIPPNVNSVQAFLELAPRR